MPDNYIIHNGELYHYGVKGMKWGVRKKSLIDPNEPKINKHAKYLIDPNKPKINKHAKYLIDPNKPKINKHAKYLIDPNRKTGTPSHAKGGPNLKSGPIGYAKRETKQQIKNTIGKKTSTELAKRGKSALDVLMNGDKDWMGEPISSSNSRTEARNRGKAAIERLLYSEDQIFNKKFFGDYNF